MRSMTGYGKGEATINGRSLVVELKAVNHRFLDLTVKLPRALIFAEDTIRKIMQKSLTRGHIDVFTTYEDKSDESALSVDIALAGNYLKMAAELQREFGIDNDYKASELLRVPDVVCRQSVTVPDAELLELVTAATNNALEGLQSMRATEGVGMAADITNRLNNVEQLTARIAVRAGLVVEDYRAKLTTRIKEAMENVPFDESRLIAEVAIFADKANIDEELARMSTHIAHYRAILSCEDEVGRKLDFLTQEMNREANTMGSKANDAEIISNVVLLKCEIEKIREQIQNLE